ncbi:MAG TPA: hypothetical protein VNV36_22835 [Pseudomonas sp.]|uniref:hypothetical protein n=1 Tax=Pseudomonas sp. TaxID=306 RepID=UPI002C83B396|nr:hypothetical protein [Pseudomonas sp.]HWH89598.1 hypothetical protein [Pseudomonas sp.]
MNLTFWWFLVSSPARTTNKGDLSPSDGANESMQEAEATHEDSTTYALFEMVGAL